MVSGAPLLRLLRLIPTRGAVGGQRGQFIQQVSVQLLGLRQGDLQQEALHHQLLQLMTKSCNKRHSRELIEKTDQEVEKFPKEQLLNTNLGAEECDALCKMNHLFPESNMKMFWVHVSPET